MNKMELKNFINEAVKISNSIRIKYDLLKTLDLSGIKSGVLYEDTKISLQNALKREDDFYKQSNISYYDALSIINILIYHYGINPMLNVEDYLLYDFNPISVVRVFFKIDALKNNCLDVSSEKIYNVLPDFMQDFLDEDTIKRDLINNNKFIDGLAYNYYMVLLSFFEGFLGIGGILEEKICDYKYLIPFLFNKIENVFIKDNLSVSSSLLLSHTMIGDAIKMARGIQEINCAAFMGDKFMNAIDKILCINDKDFKDKELDIFVREMIIRSAAIFLNEETIENFKDTIDKYIKTEAMKKNIMANDKIENIYETTKKDKSLHKYLSLNY